MNRELSLLGLARKAGKLAIGDEAVSDAIRNGSACLVVLANDSAANTRKRFEWDPGENHCKRLELPYTKEELGGALGRATCAVCAVCDIGFAATLVRIRSSACPEDESLAMLNERFAARAEEMKEVRREKRRAQKQSKSIPAKPVVQKGQTQSARRQTPKPETTVEKKTAFSYKRVFGKPGPVRNRDGSVRPYQRGDSAAGKRKYGRSNGGNER